MGDKECTGCREIKPLSYYGRHTASKDGKAWRCKDCVNKNGRAWYRKNREYKLNQNRDWRRENRDKVNAYTMKYRQTETGAERARQAVYRSREANPDKRRARNRLHYAVKTGKVHRPSECQECGREDRRIEAHHANGYEKENALNVEWLCSSCHNARHHNECGDPIQ